MSSSAYTPFLRRLTDEKARDLADTIALHRKVTAAHRASPWAGERAAEITFDNVLEQVSKFVELPKSTRVREAFYLGLMEIIGGETAIFNVSEIDWDNTVLSLQQAVDLRRFLRAQQHFLANEEQAAEALLITLVNVFVGLMRSLPEFEPDATDGSASLTVPLYAVCDDLPDVADRIMGTLFKSHLGDFGLFAELRETIYDNICRVSGVPPGTEPKKPLVLPSESKLGANEMVEAFFAGTPFFDLLCAPVPFSIPQSVRTEHMHIVAGSGHGKTQTLQHFILRDLETVGVGKASIIVIDSQSDLINTIAGLKQFAPGELLADRLVLIDPTDIEWPVALNLFDVGLERLDRYSPLDRERLINSILELYDFVLGSLLDAAMTQKQSVIFRYITRLLLHIPNATIHTLRELLEERGAEKYRQYIHNLSGSARAFFDNEFDGKEFTATKRQVLRRLYGILENQTFERMFSHPKSKLDLFAEMNAGKVILINTAKDLLKESSTEIFGRFFIAMIAQAAQERAVLPPSSRMPTFVYVDEANDYFDRTIGTILSQARKYNVGIAVAHQFLGQLDPKLHEAVAANTAIKFAGGVSAKDARALAGDLRTEPGFIESQPKLSFAAFVKGVTSRAVSLQITAGEMERRERMTEDERLAVRDIMRKRYAVNLAQLAEAAAPKPTLEAETPLREPELPAQEVAAVPDDGQPMEW